jgi:hypothetical protein
MQAHRHAGPTRETEMSFFEFLCKLFHRKLWHKVFTLSSSTDLYQCRCCRLWAVNHEVDKTLPWSQARDFYLEKGIAVGGKIIPLPKEY